MIFLEVNDEWLIKLYTEALIGGQNPTPAFPRISPILALKPPHPENSPRESVWLVIIPEIKLFSLKTLHLNFENKQQNLDGYIPFHLSISEMINEVKRMGSRMVKILVEVAKNVTLRLREKNN